MLINFPPLKDRIIQTANKEYSTYGNEMKSNGRQVSEENIVKI